MTYVITGTGAVTSVGLDVVTSGASLRAGLMRTTVVLDHGMPVTTQQVHPWTDGFTGSARWSILLELCFPDLMTQSEFQGKEDRAFWKRTGLIVCLPRLDDERYGWFADEADAECIESTLLDAMDLPLFGCREVVAAGHVGAVRATVRATDWMEQGTVDRVLIVGVDSYLDSESISWLREANRLLSDEQSNGLIPGEGCGMYMLESEKVARERGAYILAEFMGCAEGVEENSFYSENPQQAGRGLANTLRALNESCGTDLWPCEVYNDLNAEHWRAIADCNALTNLRVIWPVDDAVYHAPFDSFGETGSASAVLAVCMALQAIEQGQSNFEQTLICSSTEQGAVAALLLRQVTEPRFHSKKIISSLYSDEVLDTQRPSVPVVRSLRDQDYYALCQLHIEEAANLYGQKREAVFDDDIHWTEVDEFVGHRLEAHLVALALGGALAAEICWEHALDNLAWGQDLFVALSLFCRLNRPELIALLLEELDWDDEEVILGVTHSLCLELPQAWEESFISVCLERNANTATLAARVAAYRRLDVGGALMLGLKRWKDEPPVLGVLLHALGKIQAIDAVEAVLPLMDHANPAVRIETLKMVLRCGRTNLIALPQSEWPILLCALSGKGLLFRPYDMKAGSVEMITALGILGLGDAPEFLISMLAEEGVAKEAAFALNLITGAQLQETVFEAEEVDEDLLFDDELELYRKGELFAPGKEPGQMIQRLSQNPADWHDWWNEHKEQFECSERYRYGQLFSKETLLEVLVAAQTPHRVREWMIEELLIQFNTALALETNMPVQQQRECISKGGA